MPGRIPAQLMVIIVTDYLLQTLLGFSLKVLSHGVVTQVSLIILFSTFKGWELAKKGGAK